MKTYEIKEIEELEERQKLFSELEKEIKTLNKKQLKHLISFVANLKLLR